MFKRIFVITAVLVAVALLGVATLGVASAAGPRWGGAEAPGAPFMDADGDGLCDFTGQPVHQNFVDENGDGVNDNAPRAGYGSRWGGSAADGVEDTRPFGMGRGPGMMMGR